MALIHLTQCETDGEAQAYIGMIQDVAYDRFQLWRGLHMISEGARERPVAAA